MSLDKLLTVVVTTLLTLFGIFITVVMFTVVEESRYMERVRMKACLEAGGNPTYLVIENSDKYRSEQWYCVKDGKVI